MEKNMKITNVNELKGKTIVGVSCLKEGNGLFQLRCSDDNIYLLQKTEYSENELVVDEVSEDETSEVMNSPLTFAKRVVKQWEINIKSEHYYLTRTTFHLETENGMLLIGFTAKSYNSNSVEVNLYRVD